MSTVFSWTVGGARTRQLFSFAWSLLVFMVGLSDNLNSILFHYCDSLRLFMNKIVESTA